MVLTSVTYDSLRHMNREIPGGFQKYNRETVTVPWWKDQSLSETAKGLEKGLDKE